MAEGNKCLQDDRQRETNACRIQEEPLVKGDFSYLHSWTNNYWRRCWRVGEAGSYGGVEVKQTAREWKHCWNGAQPQQGRNCLG